VKVLRFRRLTAICAIVAFGVIVSSASAGRLSSSSQTHRVTWARMDFTGGFGTVECEVTLQGTMHARTGTKTANSLIGFVTTASVSSPCRRGGATILRETLPWHLTYDGFVGRLPNIELLIVLLIGVSFRIREPTFGVQCLLRSTTERPIRVAATREVGGRVTRLAPSGTIPCGSFSASVGATSGTWTDLPRLNALVIRLI